MKKGNKNKTSSIMGYLLLENSNFHIPEMIATLVRKYNVDVKFDESGNAFLFQYEDYIVGISCVETPMANDNAVECCKYNFLWNHSENIVASHKAHILVSIMGITNKVEGFQLFTNIMCVVANFDNAIAIYMPAQKITYNAKAYIEDAREFGLKGKKPVHLWICICPLELDATIVYTYGLNEFGKNEIEVRSENKNFLDLFDFVANLCDEIITRDIQIVDGDNIETNDGDVITAHVNEGIYVNRVSVKFNL